MTGVAVSLLWRRRVFYLAALLPFLLTAVGLSQSERKYPGRGAVSAQDFAKLTSPAAIGTTAADQVCARFTTGSTVSDPPVLQSQNGVLEVTMKFLTVTDSQGLLHYCYVTNTGLASPTLIVNPGDNLIIHFQNDLPAVAASSTSANMAGMKMTLSNDATTSTSPACNGTMGTNVTNIHYHGTHIAPVCGQDEVVHTLVKPGQSFDYNVTIPTTEPPGLYWYHPHPHGISEGQVQGGATGALIVQGIQNVYPSLAGMPTRMLVIRDQTQFGSTSPGATAAVGYAAIATVNVDVGNNYTNLFNLTCTLPSNLTESACFVNPNSITGSGTVQLTVNTTPAHPLSSKLNGRPRWLAAGGGVSLACVLLLILPRRRWRNAALGILAVLAIAFTVIGCGGSAKIDPGTAKGAYMVVVTGTAGSGSGQYQASVNVPITVQ
jgi:hypothetical protein